MNDVRLARREAVRSDPVGRYRRMLEIRVFEDSIVDLFAQGLVNGTTHTSQGQEAVAIGIAAAVAPTDWVACTYRGHALALALGMTAESVLGEITGRVTGCIGGLGGSMHMSDTTVGLLPTMAIIGAGIPIAAGAALTAQVTGTDQIAVSVFGDGASNIGAFHEGLNLAAIWKLPVVFVCENNVYGEYSRIDKTTAVADIADRAASYSMPGHVVDGQDVDAMTAAVAAAAERARAGDGPTLIEAKTYRFAGHSRADAATYRPAGELDAWLARDPITLYRRQLVAEGTLTDERADAMRADVDAEFAVVVESTLAAAEPTVEAMFQHVWA